MWVFTNENKYLTRKFPEDFHTNGTLSYREKKNGKLVLIKSHELFEWLGRFFAAKENIRRKWQLLHTYTTITTTATITTTKLYLSLFLLRHNLNLRSVCYCFFDFLLSLFFFYLLRNSLFLWGLFSVVEIILRIRVYTIYLLLSKLHLACFVHYKECTVVGFVYLLISAARALLLLAN